MGYRIQYIILYGELIYNNNNTQRGYHIQVYKPISQSRT